LPDINLEAINPSRRAFFWQSNPAYYRKKKDSFYDVRSNILLHAVVYSPALFLISLWVLVSRMNRLRGSRFAIRGSKVIYVRGFVEISNKKNPLISANNFYIPTVWSSGWRLGFTLTQVNIIKALHPITEVMESSIWWRHLCGQVLVPFFPHCNEFS